jgi:hypothetical protein
MKTRIGPSMRVALDYIANNSQNNICTADVDRAVRTARAGHRFMYATVDRLIKAGLVRTEKGPGNKALLRITELGIQNL